MNICTKHDPVLESTGSLRLVAGDLVDDIEYHWICRRCFAALDQLPSDLGKQVFYDGNEPVRPLELVA